ncbi:MAG: hypothetical protein WDN47_05100 [Candidatus Doudnabacteria bacterium]
MQAPQVVDEFLRGTRWSVFTVSANARSASEVNGVTRNVNAPVQTFLKWMLWDLSRSTMDGSSKSTSLALIGGGDGVA